MNIMIVTNSRYLKYTVVMLDSLFTHNPGEVRVFMPYEDITQDEIRDLTTFVESYPGKSFTPLYVGTEFKEMVTSRNGIMVETYYRIIGWDMLPEDVHRILYLDVDMVIKGNLDGLYNTDMGDSVFAVCEDIFGKINCFHEANKRRLGLGENDSYFNAGVMLADVDKLRATGEVKKILENVYRDYERYEYNDQDVLNEMYHDRLTYVGWDQYNCPPEWYYLDNAAAAAGEVKFATYDDIRMASKDIDSFSTKYTNLTSGLADSAKIMHYLADTKPWDSRRKEGKVYEIFDKFYYPAEEQALANYKKIVGSCPWKSSAPALIIYGVTYCYNILNDILSGLEHALNRAGIKTITYDEQEQGIEGLLQFDGMCFSSVIGVQSYLFGVYLKESGEYLFDRISGPKYNLILDHPVWLRNNIALGLKDYHILTHDENYISFIKKYFGDIDCILCPPAAHEGVEKLDRIPLSDRKYDISFIGTYGNYRDKLEMIRELHGPTRYLAAAFLETMRKNTNLTAESALELTLKKRGVVLNNEEFLEMFEGLRPMVQCVMYYYREKCVKTLIDSGLTIYIWGESWANAPFSDAPNIIIDRDVTPDEAVDIMRDSKLSLNIMAWHKGGFTERIASSMMSGSVVVTDKTSYRDGEALDDKLFMFDLCEIGALPDMVRELLADEEKLEKMSERATIYAKKNHVWDERVKRLN